MKDYLVNKIMLKEQAVFEEALRHLEKGDSVEHILPKKVMLSLEQDFEIYKYRKKLVRYQRELEQLKAKLGDIQDASLYGYDQLIMIEGLGYPLLHFTGEEVMTIHRRSEGLSKLISLYENYITTGYSAFRHAIDQIENAAAGLSASELYDCIAEVQALGSIEELRKLYFSKKLLKIIGTRIVQLQLDLRYLFRTIIRFHFKNMDDESGDTLNAIKFVRIQQVSLCNSLTHVQQRNYNTYQRAA